VAPVKRISRNRDNLILHFDPSTAPILRVGPGETFQLETADAEELVKTIRTDADLIPAEFDENFVTPSTGPIYVDGAEPGDEVVVELINVEVVPPTFTCLLKGVGLMRDHMRDVPLTRVYKVADHRWRQDQRRSSCQEWAAVAAPPLARSPRPVCRRPRWLSTRSPTV
jgi:acetamidase/formamidase